MPLTPKGRSARGQKGAGTRWGKPDLVEAADAVIVSERLDRKIQEAVSSWPPLTPEQEARLRVLLTLNGGRAG